MSKEEYLQLKNHLFKNGFENEVKYFDEILSYPCYTITQFLYEYIWVVVNSGMKFSVAGKIYSKIMSSIEDDKCIAKVFNHKGKSEAIQYVINNVEDLFNEFIHSIDKITFLESLPWIGSTTKYHLARNLGIDVCKPDRHLTRIAKKYDQDPFVLCENLSNIVGDKIGVVDFVIWRSAILGLV